MGLVSAAAAVVQDSEGRVLLVQQCYGRHLWGLPGGPIRPDETPTHAICRELLHEIGLEAKVLGLVGLYHLTGGDNGTPDLLAYTFRCEVLRGEAILNDPGKLATLGWYDPHDLPSPMTATAPAAMRDVLAGRSGVVADVVRV